MSAKVPKEFPRRGRADDRILRALEELRRGDVQWRRGRAFSHIYHGDDEVVELARRAYLAYFAEDGSSPSAFPSLRRLEGEILSILAGLLGGDSETVGTLTSGTTESIFLAVRAARRWARSHQPKNTRPEMIVAESAHPAFAQAGRYFGLHPVIAPIDASDYGLDMAGVTRALSERTTLVVGSAPSYPHGIVDPITELARLASKRGLLCHVDTSLGGFVLPFLASLNEPVPPFDLRVDGVTSINVDLQRYGRAPVGASAVLYRSPELRRHQFYAAADWPGGIYASPNFTGSRPGGTIAATWAVLHKLGFEGYREHARELMETSRTLREGVTSIEGLEVLGQPIMSVMAFGSRLHDIYELGDHMAGRGWLLERQQLPPSLHLTVTRAHQPVADEFLADLRDAAEATAQFPVERIIDRTRHMLIGAAARVLPRRFVSRVTTMASSRLGADADELPSRTASLHGLMAALPNRGDLVEVALDTLDALTTYDPSLGDVLPDPHPATKTSATADEPTNSSEKPPDPA